VRLTTSHHQTAVEGRPGVKAPKQHLPKNYVKKQKAPIFAGVFERIESD